MNLSRRSALFGLLAAPAIIRPGLLMPVKTLVLPSDDDFTTDGLRVRITERWTSRWDEDCSALFQTGTLVQRTFIDGNGFIARENVLNTVFNR